MSGERFLVTGAEGCIGSWVLKNLVQAGHPCLAVDLSTAARRLRRILPTERLSGIRFVAGDVTTEGLLDSLIRDHRITRIIHLAALQVPLVQADPLRGARVNVEGTVCVLEAARRSEGRVRSVVYASSVAALGPGGPGSKPSTLYGVFKTTNEETARVYAEDWGLSSVGLRPWAVFGPGRDQGITAAPTQAMKAAVLGVRYHIPFGGRVDLQYADDVARIFIRAALTEVRGAPVYNLRGEVLRVEEVIALIEELWPSARGLVSCGSEPLPFPAELGPPQVEELLGAGVPRTDFAPAVAASLEHFQGLARAGELTPRELETAAG